MMRVPTAKSLGCNYDHPSSSKFNKDVGLDHSLYLYHQEGTIPGRKDEKGIHTSDKKIAYELKLFTNKNLNNMKKRQF